MEINKRLQDAIKRAIPKITNCRIDEANAAWRRERLYNEIISICQLLNSIQDTSENRPTAGSASNVEA